MENNTPQKTEKTPEEVSAAWSKIGLAMREADMRLQAMAQKSLAKIKIPTTVAEIIEAEKLVVELRNDYTEIQTERKKLTGKLDYAITHLMKSEKLLSGDEKAGIPSAVKPLMDATVKLKQQAELENNKIKWHGDEVKQIKEKIANHISGHDSICKRKIIDLVDKAYSYALGNGDIKPEEKDAYISNVLNNTKNGQKQGRETEFKIEMPTVQFKYVTQEEIHELWEHAVSGAKMPYEYVGDLHDALQAKFEFYDIAVKNKTESLRQAREDKEKAENEILKTQSDAETANKLNAIATVHTATPVTTHKDLKKVYEIEMPVSTEENPGASDATAIMIMTAFVGNFEKCNNETRVSDIYNLSIKQMAVALCKVKNKDNSFEFGTLKFKQVDKL